ncbi:uncharacterized protein BO66DRAFT_159725 [Aspergillus aculeatinus CBS 121060]|uniref:Uncharacterized protein n=1 Tax=Aspergillus aculeatinus CBS 121060 TaxID=1448322 RepID=A0ACD1H177_9EURO|nr:hypothetical protein BO66DRAFT_159725 [Aspergillus aculeatinus CBS 121060]RAH67175.1 hypothetical protein BO66DRAFT_159725 [Aspergillus aculeatinus CBS 121060]
MQQKCRCERRGAIGEPARAAWYVSGGSASRACMMRSEGAAGRYERRSGLESCSERMRVVVFGSSGAFSSGFGVGWSWSWSVVVAGEPVVVSGTGTGTGVVAGWVEAWEEGGCGCGCGWEGGMEGCFFVPRWWWSPREETGVELRRREDGVVAAVLGFVIRWIEPLCPVALPPPAAAAAAAAAEEEEGFVALVFPGVAAAVLA